MKKRSIENTEALPHELSEPRRLVSAVLCALSAVALAGCPTSGTAPPSALTGSGGGSQPSPGTGGSGTSTTSSGSGGGTGWTSATGAGTGGKDTTTSSGGTAGAAATWTGGGGGGAGTGGTGGTGGNVGAGGSGPSTTPGAGGAPTGGTTTSSGSGGAAGAAGGVSGVGGNSAGGAGGGGGSSTVVIGTGGSGGSGGSGGTGGSGATPSLQPLASAFCAAARACCSQKAYPTAPLADCETQFQSRLRTLALVNKGTVTIDTAGLAQCVAGYQKAATTCAWDDAIDACQAVWVGTRTTGQTCGSGNQAGGYECKKSGGPTICFWTQSPSDPSITGTCMPMPHGKLGDTCVGTCRSDDVDCSVDLYASAGDATAFCYQSDGLYCSNNNGVSTCKALLTKGAACSTIDTDACGAASYCDWNDSTCKLSASLGQSCQTIACLSRYQCSGTDYKCKQVPLANDDLCLGKPPVP